MKRDAKVKFFHVFYEFALDIYLLPEFLYRLFCFECRTLSDGAKHITASANRLVE